MDYKRIYAEFIKDRREKESEITGYFERHHIVPRSLGGGDDPDNLVRLTPEDHYFAHLLLAKIHGGPMWAAVHAMCHLAAGRAVAGRERIRHRLNFGHVRRSLADYYRSISSGPDSHSADQRRRRIRHFDGREVSGNRFELEAKTGVPRSQLSALFIGEKKSAHGWYCPKRNSEGLTRNELISKSLRSRVLHTLYHHDGRTWTGTLGEFRDMTGLQLSWQSDRHVSIAGWYRSKKMAARHVELITEKARLASSARGDISGRNNPMAGSDRRKDMKVRLVHKTGDSFSGSLKAFADERGIDAVTYGRMRKTLMGKKIVDGKAVKSFWGWSLAH